MLSQGLMLSLGPVVALLEWMESAGFITGQCQSPSPEALSLALCAQHLDTSTQYNPNGH